MYGLGLGMAMFPLIELEKVLRSKKGTLKLTPQEANNWLSWKSEIGRNAAVGVFGAGTAVMSASWKLKNDAFRLLLSSEKVLKMDGSILQKELANIMVTKYQNEPSLMSLMSKHFYLERIFDDSTSTNPKLRWRFRNFFIDNGVHDHRTHDNDYYDNTQGDSHSDSSNNSQGDSGNVNDSRKTNFEIKHNFTKAGPDIKADIDPLDFLFGYGAQVEETHYPNTPNKPSGTHNRRHRRSHRRHRMRNPEDLSNSKLAATL